MCITFKNINTNDKYWENQCRRMNSLKFVFKSQGCLSKVLVVSAGMCAKLPHLCLTLCHPTDCSPPDSSVRGVLQVRILERVTALSSGGLPNRGIEPASYVSRIGNPYFSPTHENWEAPRSLEETQKVGEPVKTD